MRALSSSGARRARGESDLADSSLLERLARIDWMPSVILAVGALLRFLLLGIKPPHFDEGINGWFVDQMTKNGFYKYDPTNYHGPLHFYILFLSQTLLGRNIWALRLPVVLGSIGAIFVALKFEPFTGRAASRVAAFAMAISPGFIFYGRYSIHEVWLLLFSMLFVLGLFGLWRIGARGYLWSVGMGLAGMILTKETYIIHVGCALIAGGVLWVSHRIAPLPDLKPARQLWDLEDLAMVIVTAAFFIIFFYSGTFFNWAGVRGLYETFGTWLKTGSNGNGHEKPWPYWLELILRYEWPIVIGLFLCLLCQFYNNFAIRYLAIYGVGVLAAYSIVHYKTPWCIISIVWPFLFVFGAGATAKNIRLPAFYGAAGALLGFSLGVVLSYPWQSQTVHTSCSLLSYLGEALTVTLAASSTSPVCHDIGEVLFTTASICALLGGGIGIVIGRPKWLPISAAGMRAVQTGCVCIALLISLTLAISLNYFHCTTDTEPYVYVQTYNDIYKLMRPVMRLVQRAPANYRIVGHFVRTSAYPFPWLLGDFPNVGYYEHNNLPAKADADFLLVQEDRIHEIEKLLHESYYTDPLTIRPYQDTSKLYLNVKTFHNLFHGRQPDFPGKPAAAAGRPSR